MEIMQSKSKALLIALLVILLVLGLVYFLQQKGFKPKSPANYIDSKIEDKVNQTKESKTGEKTEAPVAIPGVEFRSYPEDFPKDLVVFPANFEQSLRYKNPQGQEVISVTYIVPNNQQATIDMFKTILAEAKWNIDQKKLDKTELLTVSKENLRAEITIDPIDKNSSKVHLLYYLPK